ncbi:MAG: hypothetical protein NT166_07935 [Candidatus Aminicenantes bacterium]|nr:hypothetical protein [Candidatus Aminicenantes bacterium]
MKVSFKNVSKVIVVVFVCALSCLLLDAEDHKLELKLNAGAAYCSIGQFNDFMDGRGWNVSGEGWNHAHWGMDASAEMVYRLSKNHGISVGTGFLWINRWTGDGIYMRADLVLSGYKTRIQAVPLTLNFHYTIPLGQKLRLNTSAGPGLYFGRFSLKSDAIWPDGPHKMVKKTHGAALGGQAAMGLEMDLGRHLALIVEMNGRLVRFTTMMGKIDVWKDGEKIGQEKNMAYNLDLSGVGLRLGMKLYL